MNKLISKLNKSALMGFCSLSVLYSTNIYAQSLEEAVATALDSHPDIYLHGALHQAEGFFHNDRRMPIWERKCDIAIAQLNDSANRSRIGSGPMIPRVRTVI